MEGFGGLGVSDGNSAVRKKRSNASRRPRNESPLSLDYREHSSLSDVSKGSGDENNGYGTVTRKKEMNLNLCNSRASFCNNAESESSKNVIKNEDGGPVDSDEASNNGSFRGSSNEPKHSGSDSKRCSKGVLAPANWTNTTNVGHFESISDDLDHENKVKKVKLRVCGVTKTIHANSISDGASAVGSSTTKSSHVSYAPRPRQKIIQDSVDNRPFTSDKGTELHRRPSKNSRNVFNAGKDDSPGADENIYAKEIGNHDPGYKSKRVTRRRLIDDALDEEEDNNLEVQYLEKLRVSRIASDYDAEYKEDEERDSRKQRRISKVLKRGSSDNQYDLDMGDYGSSRLRKEAKKTRSGRISDDTDYVEEEDSISDNEPNSKRRKPRKEFINSIGHSKKEMTVTTRQRALQTGKDVSSILDANLIEFPNGLPPAPPRKQKEKLTEVEQQLKKAEAAQRRRMQVEKAARESEAEAIRKILGQDSSRKKKEDKIKKRQEDRAQERAANCMIIASDSVRWVLGPSGTIVTFPNEMGLPTIFNSKPCNYPPPREKCAGPSCTNSYKYRDSESKLPLCSLQCYKAIHEKMSPLTTC